MTPEEVGQNGGWMAAIGAAMVGSAIGLRKVWLLWKNDGATAAEIDARQALTLQLHTELTRMGAQNMLLATELNKLQLHILELTKQVGEMTGKNATLGYEVVQLRIEITRLQSLIPSAVNGAGASK